jgi:hypothetical protein
MYNIRQLTGSMMSQLGSSRSAAARFCSDPMVRTEFRSILGKEVDSMNLFVKEFARSVKKCLCEAMQYDEIEELFEL